MSTVLVTGAAGNLGRRVTAKLVALPWVERALAVDRLPVAATSPRIEAHHLDLAGPGAAEELAALAKRASAFLHLAWEPEGGPNLTVLGNVLDAAASVGPGQLVHLSSATVYGAWEDNPVPLTEGAPPRPNPQFAYAVEKHAAELALEHWSLDHPEVLVAVLRPACTLGAPDRPFYRALPAGRRPSVGGDDRLVQFLHLDDLASAVVHVFELGLQGVYNVAPDSGVREDVARALQGGPAALPMPGAVRDAVGGLAAWRWRRLGHGWPNGARAYGEHPWVIAADKLHLTGWRAEYSSEQALVVTDGRRHWDDLPLARRVSVTLGAAAVTTLAATAGGAAWWHRHH